MKDLKESLSEFLKSETNNVAILKGDWGSGKTYFWKTILSEEWPILEKAKKFDSYSYISLFGCKDIHVVKKQIFTNSKPFDSSNIGKVKALKGKGAEVFRKLDIPYVPSELLADWVENAYTKKLLICIDDLERKEIDLTTSSVLGLISNLAEERNCKILLIHNGEDNQEIKSALNQYREKVVDLEFKFDPTIADCLKIIWPNGCHEEVARVFETLKVNNLRIMKKARTVFEYFEKNLLGQIPEISDQIALDAAALSVFHFCHSEKFEIEQVIGRAYWTTFLKNEEANKEVFEALTRIKYGSNGFTPLVVDYLRNGYVNFDERRALIDEEKTNLKNNEIADAYREAWSRFHSSFAYSQEEVVEGFLNLMKQYGTKLGVKALYEIREFISTYSPQMVSDELLELAIGDYVENRKSKRVDLAYSNFPAELQDKIRSKLKSVAVAPDLDDLIRSLTDPRGWDPADFELFDRISDDALETWIFEDKNNDSVGTIRTLLSRFSSDPSAGRMLKQTKEIVEKLRARSPMDRKRVEFIEKK